MTQSDYNDFDKDQGVLRGFSQKFRLRAEILGLRILSTVCGLAVTGPRANRGKVGSRTPEGIFTGFSSRPRILLPSVAGPLEARVASVGSRGDWVERVGVECAPAVVGGGGLRVAKTLRGAHLLRRAGSC